MGDASTSILLKIDYWRRCAWAIALVGIGFVAGFIGGICALIGIVLFFGETIEWLKSGSWNRSTVAHEFYHSLPSSTQAWINAPDNWYGLWTVVSEVGTWSAWWVFLLLSLPLLFVSAILLTTSDMRSEQLTEERNRKSPTSSEEMSGADLMRIVRGDGEEGPTKTR